MHWKRVAYTPCAIYNYRPPIGRVACHVQVVIPCRMASSEVVAASPKCLSPIDATLHAGSQLSGEVQHVGVETLQTEMAFKFKHTRVN